MRDDLVGFLVGALDASEHDELAKKLDEDQQLRQELKLVERGLEPLRWDSAQVEPPRGLASRTCEMIDQHTVTQPIDRTSGMSSASGRESSGRRRRWTVADFVVAAGVCVAAACLFFPAIINSRYHHQLNVCQMKMRDIGLALTDYSMNDRRGMFPAVPAKGNLAVAGMYAPTLLENGFVKDPNVFYCPAKSNTIVLKIPSVDVIRSLSAEAPELEVVQGDMGGDYAYTLGFFENGKLRGVRNQGREFYPVLADEPREHLSDSVVTSHGVGQNLFFEDGRVAFRTTRLRPNSDKDDLFKNDNDAWYGAGVHADDAVLAPSAIKPTLVGYPTPAR